MDFWHVGGNTKKTNVKIVCIWERSWQKLLEREESLSNLTQCIRCRFVFPQEDGILNCEEVCRVRDITKRTLQSYRDRGAISARVWAASYANSMEFLPHGSPGKPFKHDNHATGLFQRSRTKRLFTSSPCCTTCNTLCSQTIIRYVNLIKESIHQSGNDKNKKTMLEIMIRDIAATVAAYAAFESVLH